MTLPDLCRAIGWPHWLRDKPVDRMPPLGEILRDTSTDHMLLLAEHRWPKEAWGCQLLAQDHINHTWTFFVYRYDAEAFNVPNVCFEGIAPTPAAAIFAALVARVEKEKKT